MVKSILVAAITTILCFGFVHSVSSAQDLRSQLQARSAPVGQSYSNGGVRGGGGDEIDPEFRRIAQRIYDDISEVEFYRKTIGGKKLQELGVAIRDAIVAPVDYSLTVEVQGKDGRTLHLPRPARCTANLESGDMLIEVNIARYNNMSKLKKRRLVFHEYLCLVGLETTNDYKYSNGLYSDSVLLPSLGDLGLVEAQLEDFGIPRFVSEKCILQFYQTLSDVWRVKNTPGQSVSFETGARIRFQSEQCMGTYIRLEAQNIPKKMESNADELERLTFIARILQMNYLIFINSRLMQEFPNFNRTVAHIALEEERTVKAYNREFLGTVINEVTRVLLSADTTMADRIRFGYVKAWLDFLNEQPVFED